MPRNMNRTEADLHKAALAATKRNKISTGLFIPARFSTNGVVQVMNFDLDKGFGDLQKAVGGYVEIVTLPSGNVLAMDEEGRLKAKPVNRLASEVAQMELVGSVVFIPSKFSRKVLG